MSGSVQAADPYNVLQLRRDATAEAIARAYRKLSMRWHPDRNSNNPEAVEKFSNVNEAYDVLTTRALRAVLDKQGLVALGQNYTFTKNPDTMFASFFGTNNPFSVLQESVKTSAELSIAGPPSQIQSLDCTLEELYVGCIKRSRVERVVVSEDGMDQKHEDVVVDVVVKPGYMSGTSITFKGKGDVLPGMTASDLTFLINELSHKDYQRVGNDVLYTANITLAQALGKCELNLRWVDLLYIGII